MPMGASCCDNVEASASANSIALVSSSLTVATLLLRKLSDERYSLFATAPVDLDTPVYSEKFTQLMFELQNDVDGFRYFGSYSEIF